MGLTCCLILIFFVISDVSYFIFLLQTARDDSGDSYMNGVSMILSVLCHISLLKAAFQRLSTLFPEGLRF